MQSETPATPAKHVLSDVEGAPRVRRISKCITSRAWRLGAINFLKVVLLNIGKNPNDG